MSNKSRTPDLTGKKILIIRLSSLGDILLTTPVIRTLKSNFQAARIDFILKEQYKDVLKLNPHISNLFLYEKTKEEIKSLILELKHREYDIVIDLQNNFRSNQITRALNTKSFSFDKRTLDKFLLVRFKINRLRDAARIPVRYASTVPGIELDDEGLELITDKNPAASLEERSKIIGIAPGSRHFTKMWPREYFISLGKKLREAGYDIVLLGGKDDLSVCSEISGKIPGSINACTGDNLLQTAADMKKCLAVICNDSGMMHTAGTAKVPVLTFYGSTVKEFGFTPYKTRNLILENNSLTCRPCSHIGRDRCPKGHFRCMLEITPEKAYDAIMTLLKS